MKLVCPTCAEVIPDEAEHLWWFYGKEYCSEECVRAIRTSR